MKGALLLLFAIPVGLSAARAEAAQGVTEAPFGQLDDGRKVTLTTLTNSAGAEARIINYGAILVSLKVPDRQGTLRDVVLGYDDLAGYVKDKSFLGATVGRYANRIAGGKFTLDGKTYQLDLNNPPNHLHGGAEGFYKKLWHSEPVKGKDGPGVKLTYVSPDGEGAYPGKVTLTVTYTLTRDNALRIAYHGTTDKPTVLNATHHSYFNLSGDPTKPILDEQLTHRRGQDDARRVEPDSHGPAAGRGRDADGFPAADPHRRAHRRQGPAARVRQGLRPQLGAARPGQGRAPRRRAL